jgi:hypothetical protein
LEVWLPGFAAKNEFNAGNLASAGKVWNRTLGTEDRIFSRDERTDEEYVIFPTLGYMASASDRVGGGRLHIVSRASACGMNRVDLKLGEAEGTLERSR